MPYMTCLPCDVGLLITPADAPHCPTCLGPLLPISREEALARCRRGAGSDAAASSVNTDAYRMVRLQHQARRAVTQSIANRARLQELRAENARLRSELASTVAAVRGAVDG